MLTQKQMTFIPEYLQTGCIKTACKKARVTEYTYQKWRRNAEFVTELNKQENILYDASLDKMRNSMHNAVDTLTELLQDDSSVVKLRASNLIINNIIKLIELKEINARLDALEKEAEENNTDYEPYFKNRTA